MPKLPQRRRGSQLEIKGYKIPFSMWPTRKTGRRCTLNTKIFATNPWPIIKERIEKSNLADDIIKEALSYCEQSEDFFLSSQVAKVSAAKPILLYYAFMNLAKAFILIRSVRKNLSDARHGLQGGSAADILSAPLKVHVNSTYHNIFSDFSKALSGIALTNNKVYNVGDLIPQIIIGHRLWLDGIRISSPKEKERFICVDNISFLHGNKSHSLWLRMTVHNSDLKRLGYGINEFIRMAGGTDWRSANSGMKDKFYYEQKAVIRHNGSPADFLCDLTKSVDNILWQTVRIDEPYRKYYLYACPISKQDQQLPQILSIYAVMYYLSSITRYQPLMFDDIIKGPFGAFIESFINDQPTQFLYLMASHFADRDVTKAAIA